MVYNFCYVCFNCVICTFYSVCFIRLAADVGKIPSERQYHGMIDCIVKTYRTDGIKGLYRGFNVSVQGIILYRACYFGLFDTSKDFLPNPKNTPFLIAFIIAQVMLAIR